MASKKKTATQAKLKPVTPKPAARRASAPDVEMNPAPGSIVWIRWEAGRYKIGLLTRRTKDGDPVCRVARVDPKGNYTGEGFGTERTFKPGEVSRVFHERDWESMTKPDGSGEGMSDFDNRLARGPVVDGDGQVRGDVANLGGKPTPIDSVDEASDACQRILDDKPIASGTLRNLARWVEHLHSRLEEREPPVADEPTKLMHSPAMDAVFGAAGLRSLVGKIVSVIRKRGQQAVWEACRVIDVRDGVLALKTHDDIVVNVLAVEEGKAWELAPMGSPLANMSLDDIEHTLEMDRPDYQERFDNSTLVRRIIVPEKRATAPTPTSGPPTRILVKVKRTWEDATVDRVTDALAFFTATNGAEGSVPWSTFGKGWRHVGLPDAYASSSPETQAQMRITFLRVLPSDLVVAELERQASTTMIAVGAEKERKKVERGTKRAVQKVMGTDTPVGRVAAGVRRVERTSEPIEHDMAPEQAAPPPKPEKILSLHQQNLAKAKALGIPTHELPAYLQREAERRQRENEEAATQREEDADMSAVISRMRTAGERAPSSPTVDAEERALATRRELEHLDMSDPFALDTSDPWDEVNV